MFVLPTSLKLCLGNYMKIYVFKSHVGGMDILPEPRF